MSSQFWWGDWRPTLTPHTGNLQPTDLIECTMIVGGSPVNTAITGAQIIAAAAGGGGLTVGTTAIASGTNGRVLFQAAGVLQQDASFFWDNTNKRLGVGATPSTSVRLDVRAQGALSTDIAFRVRNSADTADIISVNGDGSQSWNDPLNNAFTTIRSNTSTLIQWGNTNFLNIGIGHSHTMTATNLYNILIGGNSTISSGTNEAIKIGTFGVSTGVGSINIGYSGRVNGQYTIKIGRHVGASSFGGSNSIHLGRTVSGNDVLPDDVFMTYFNSQLSSTLTRSNGSFGLLGQGAYILANGTGANGLTTFMGNGGNTLVVRNHASIPSTNIVDTFQMYSNDIVAGNAAPHIRTENGNVIKIYRETTAIAAAAFVANTSLIFNDSATYGGYTMGQVVAALKAQGLLA